MSESNPPRKADYPPGFDEEDPYEGEDLSEYPEWWRKNILLFREHDMRPYRPPQFKDGELTTEVISELRKELGVEIQLRAIDPHDEGKWQIWVDEEPVASLIHTREGEGFTRYSVDSDEFKKIVRSSQ